MSIDIGGGIIRFPRPIPPWVGNQNCHSLWYVSCLPRAVTHCDSLVQPKLNKAPWHFKKLTRETHGLSKGLRKIPDDKLLTKGRLHKHPDTVCADLASLVWSCAINLGYASAPGSIMPKSWGFALPVLAPSSPQFSSTSWIIWTYWASDSGSTSKITLTDSF